MEDTFEVRNLKKNLEIRIPQDVVEISETFGVNCLIKHCTFIKNHFTEIWRLKITLFKRCEPCDVFKHLYNVKVIMFVL